MSEPIIELTFKTTNPSSPERHDILYNGHKVGQTILNHGAFVVDYIPSPGTPERVFCVNLCGIKGEFPTSNLRTTYHTKAADAIRHRMKKGT